MLKIRLNTEVSDGLYEIKIFHLEVRFKVKFLFWSFYKWKSIYSQSITKTISYNKDEIIKELILNWLMYRSTTYQERMKLKIFKKLCYVKTI